MDIVMADSILTFQIVSIISVFGSLVVILTPILFQSLRRKLFMRIIMFISIADFFGNIFYISPFRPRNGTWLCSMSGFFNLYFYPVSWFWSTMLSYFLFNMAMYGCLPLSEIIINLICWGIPLMLVFPIPFFASFGRNDDDDGLFIFEVCSAVDGGIAYSYYHALSYYGIWILCILMMFYWYLRIRFSNLSVRFGTEWKHSYYSSLNSLRWYPTAMFLFWLPHTLFSMMSIFSVYRNASMYAIGSLIKVLHGGVVAVIFFWRSREAQLSWWRLIASYSPMKLIFHNRESMDSTLSFSNDQEDEGEDFSLEYVSVPKQALSESLIVNPLSNFELPVRSSSVSLFM